MNEKIKDKELTVIVRRNMYDYGIDVNEDRSVPCLIDGLKPVQRRTLWAMYNLGLSRGPTVKLARIVGEVLGKYHPHGDKAAADSVATLVMQPAPSVIGEGNWGSRTGDGPAGMRYINAKLSKYGAAFFDPYYMPVLDVVPNYDGKDKEPVLLFAPLPNLLLNGSSGIGVGLTTDIPSFSPKSVINLLQHTIKTGPATPSSCYKHLEFVTGSGALVDKSSQKEGLKQFFSTGSGAVAFNSNIAWDAKKKAWHLTGVAPFQGESSYVAKIWGVADLEGVSNVEDHSRNDNIDFWIFSNGRNVEDVEAKLRKHLTSTKHFRCNVNERKLVNTNGWPEVEVSLHSLPVHEIVNRWLIWRRDLEVRATNHQLEVLKRAMRKNEVLLLACKFRDYILGLIKDDKKTEEQIKDGIKKTLKLTTDEMMIVYDLQWRRLRTLEAKQLAEDRRKMEKQQAEYLERIAKPERWMLESLQQLKEIFA